MPLQLNKEQDTAVRMNDRSLLIVAGAGTGKTRVLVEKIILLLSDGVDERGILALTFTNKASDEMRDRVRDRVGSDRIPFIGTFHSLCVSLLREFHADAGIPERFSIFDRNACRRVLKRCMKREGISDITPRAMQHAVGRLKTDPSVAVDDDLMREAERILPLYTLELGREEALDFDDLLLLASRLLRESERARSAVQSRYSYILVDEFQDTDATQNRLISLLKGDRTRVIAVGDTDQTIYSWRGASAHTMLSFTDQHDPVSTVLLTKNYRSTGTILEAANAVISKNAFRHDKDLVATRSDGDPITIIRASDEEDEASRIADEILLLHSRGIPFREISVLFRANFQSRALEMHMLSRRVPYIVLGARFFDRAEIQDLLCYLSLASNPRSRESFTRASRAPRRGIGERTLERVFSGEESALSSAMAGKVAGLRSDITRITEAVNQGTVASALRAAIGILDYRAHLTKSLDDPEGRMRSVHELISFSDRFSHLPGREGAARMLSEIALSSEQDSLRAGPGDAVRLMTVHAAKGLEFSRVFIAGMEEGLFPFTHESSEDRDAEEERRLCYVAMTRAKDALYCSCAARRGIFGSYRNALPSSFLRDIPDHLSLVRDFTESGGDSDSDAISW